MSNTNAINNLESSSQNSIQLIASLTKFISKKRKKQLFFSFLSVLVAGIAEISSISITLPFITLLTDENKILDLLFFKKLIIFFGINSNQLINYIFYLLIITVVFAAVVRLFNLWLIHRVVMNIGNDLSTDAFKKILYQPYKFHLNYTSSNNIASLEKNIDAVILAIESLILAFTGLFIIICIVITLLKINLSITLSTAIIFSSSYFLISLFSKKRLIKNSKYTVNKQPQRIKIVQEGIGGIRDIILDNTQDYFVSIFGIIDKQIKDKTAQNIFISSSPRYIIEALSIVIICSISYFIYNKDFNNFNSIAILGTFALGAQKLIPNMQTVYRCWQSVNNKRYELIDINNILNLDFTKVKKNKKNISLKTELVLKDIDFNYEKSNRLFNKLNLKIKAGERIGIIGSTGSGKSTLVDIIMGLLKPDKGQLIIDGKDIHNLAPDTINKWMASISHVPQDIFLTDRTFIENIAFGLSKKEVDLNLVKKAASKARIEEFINTSKYGYKTLIGERGVRLSGGQRQRIGIARALYKNTNLIIFDEATSSLDNQMEDQIMKTIYSLEKKLTIIIVAHRLRTVRGCDKILELKKGKIIEHKTDQLNLNDN